ncbi:MAG: hypothetical protein AAF492_17725, partial [Verrucomicrobiota bacterium]
MTEAILEDNNTAPAPEAEPPARSRPKVKWDALAHGAENIGLGFFAPFFRLAGGDKPKEQLGEICRNIFLPLSAIGLFMMFWSFCSVKVQTDSWKIPGPKETWQAALGIHQ